MKLRIAGYKGKGMGSSFIKWFTFSEYSHVSMIFPDGTEYEAIQGQGVIKHDFDDKSPADLFYVDVCEHQIKEARALCENMLGAKYDWKGIWGFLRRKKRHSADKWFCSEAVAYVCDKIGHPLSRREPYRHRPEDVCMSYVIHKEGN